MVVESSEMTPRGRIANQWQRAEFLLREVSANIRLNPLMSLAAVSIAAFSLLTLGLFYLLLANLTDLMQREARKVGIQVYLPVNWKDSQREEVERRLKALPAVASLEYVSSEEALKRLKGQLGGDRFLEDLGRNELPASFAIEVASPEQVEPLAATLGKWPEFEDVRYSKQLTARLLRVMRLIKVSGGGLLIILVAVSCVILGNTIRLTILARRREIRIMQLVGATNAFIRMPFLVEGLLHGMAGAAIATLLLLAGYHWALRWVASVPFMQLVDDPILLWQMSGLLIVAGMLFGGLGSWLSIRTCLREDDA